MTRFPESGWLEGSVEGLTADIVRLVSVPQRTVDEAARPFRMVLTVLRGCWMKFAHSNDALGSPDCRIIDINVPIRSSRWSGTGTVVVSPLWTLCISMWLPLRRTSVKPCAASIAQTSRPDST
jgi:hypothetical protein